MTYPHAAVERALTDDFVACRLESAKAPELARAANVRWLPGLVVASPDGRPAHVQVGFLPPDDFLRELDFGAAIVAMGGKRYDEADALFAKVAARDDAERAPDAWYWRGISRYRQTKAFEDCQRHWAEIPKRWPGTQWARRVEYALAKR